MFDDVGKGLFCLYGLFIQRHSQITYSAKPQCSWKEKKIFDLVLAERFNVAVVFLTILFSERSSCDVN